MEKDNQQLSMRRQCDILSFNRSSLYYERIGLSEEDQRILEEMDKIYLDFPFYGSRRMSRELKRRGYKVGRHKARSLMRILGVEAIYPRKRLSFPNKEHQIYPYLLRDVTIDRPDIAWATDITYIYKEVYTKSYETVAECRASIGEFIRKYNQDRLHQSLGEYDTPLEAYRQMQMAVAC